MAKGKVAKGFGKLEGVKIISVSAKAINEVVLTADDGTIFVIEGEIGVLGIPHLTLKKKKRQHEISALIEWPFPS